MVGNHSFAIRDIKKDKFYQFPPPRQRDASLPLWNRIERKMHAESCISRMRRRTYERCQGHFISVFRVTGITEYLSITQHHPAQ